MICSLIGRGFRVIEIEFAAYNALNVAKIGKLFLLCSSADSISKLFLGMFIWRSVGQLYCIAFDF